MYNFQLFERTPEAEISNIADVVETFYSFNAQIAKKLPQAFADANVDCVKLLHFGEFFLQRGKRLIDLQDDFFFHSRQGIDPPRNGLLKASRALFDAFHSSIAKLSESDVGDSERR